MLFATSHIHGIQDCLCQQIALNSWHRIDDNRIRFELRSPAPNIPFHAGILVPNRVRLVPRRPLRFLLDIGFLRTYVMFGCDDRSPELYIVKWWNYHFFLLAKTIRKGIAMIEMQTIPIINVRSNRINRFMKLSACKSCSISMIGGGPTEL